MIEIIQKVLFAYKPVIFEGMVKSLINNDIASNDYNYKDVILFHTYLLYFQYKGRVAERRVTERGLYLFVNSPNDHNELN